MRRIYKWALSASPVTNVPWSPGDRVLLVADQGGHLMLWAEQEDGRPVPSRQFFVVGTGFEAPPGMEHVGSAVVGEFVWHVYAEAVSS